VKGSDAATFYPWSNTTSLYLSQLFIILLTHVLFSIRQVLAFGTSTLASYKSYSGDLFRVAHRAQARLAHPLREVLLLGEVADRLDEVLVGGAVGGDDLAEPRDDAEGVPLVRGGEQPAAAKQRGVCVCYIKLWVGAPMRGCSRLTLQGVPEEACGGPVS